MMRFQGGSELGAQPKYYRHSAVPSLSSTAPLETAVCFYPRGQDFLTNLRPYFLDAA
jgi:hypothetical protein